MSEWLFVLRLECGHEERVSEREYRHDVTCGDERGCPSCGATTVRSKYSRNWGGRSWPS